MVIIISHIYIYHSHVLRWVKIIEWQTGSKFLSKIFGFWGFCDFFWDFYFIFPLSVEDSFDVFGPRKSSYEKLLSLFHSHNLNSLKFRNIKIFCVIAFVHMSLSESVRSIHLIFRYVFKSVDRNSRQNVRSRIKSPTRNLFFTKSTFTFFFIYLLVFN